MTMSFTATVSRDVVVTPALNTPTNVALTRRGQNGRVLFDGTAGVSMAVQIGGISTAPAGGSLATKIVKPDGTTLATTTSAYGSAFNLSNLPVTGTYTLFIDPQYGASANVIVTVVPSNSVDVAIDGPSRNVSTAAAPGQYAYFTFSATAGDKLGLGISNLVKTSGSPSFPQVLAYVYMPDGTEWTSATCTTTYGGCDLNLGIVATGVYSVIVRSQSASAEPNMTMSFTATVSRDVVVTPALNTLTNVNLNLRGQNARIVFEGTAGSARTVQVSGISTTPSGRSLAMKVVKPDGTTLASTTSGTNYTFNLANLPVTGTYFLFVDPVLGASANLAVKIN
jgi:hypothetical protein